MKLSRTIKLFTGTTIFIVSVLFGITAFELSLGALTEQEGGVIVLILAAIVALLGICVSVLCGKAISRPIKELHIISEKLAKDETYVDLNAFSNDEVRAIMQYINKMNEDYIIVPPFDERVGSAVAKAVYEAAVNSGVARK